METSELKTVLAETSELKTVLAETSELKTLLAETSELKILLALEPVWTVSFNAREFQTVREADIEVMGDSVCLNGSRHIIETISWLRPNVARVRVRRRFQSRRDVLTFYPGDRPSSIDTRRRRSMFQKSITNGLARYLGVRRVDLKNVGSGRGHGIGAAYLQFRTGPRHVIAVSPDESQPMVDGIMRAAILWAELGAGRLAVVVPDGRRAAIVSRLQSMPRLAAALEWLQWDGQVIAPLNRSVLPVETRVDARHTSDAAIEAEAVRLVSMKPDLLRLSPASAGKALSVRMRGLEVARVTGKGATYPMGMPLESVIQELEQKRRHGSRHPLACVFEERWLEANLVDQIDRVLPSVDRRHIYPQVPSFIGQERHTVDLLTVTGQGRLAVIEIKVGPDPDLPFQALDYWLAVERHRKAGDFHRGGYFPGVDILDEPALLIVVAPLLSFHKTFDRMVAFFPDNAPIIQVGVADTWKKNIRVLRRKGAVD